MGSFSWIVWFGVAITCFTIVHHIILIVVSLLANSDLPQQYKQLQVFATLIFLANLLWNIVNLPIGFIPLNHPIFGCHFFFGIIMILYYIGKCCIWYYNILRLEFIFYRVPLGYSKKLLNKFKVMFVISAIILATICIFGMVPTQNKDDLCVLDFELWANGSIMIPDAIMSCLCYWLFHRKMTKLTNLYNIRHINQSDDNFQDDAISTQFLYVLRKFTILCAVTIISTWITGTISIICADLSMVMGSVDSIINVWCILLYDKRYDNIYVIVFRCIAKSEWNKPVKQTKSEVSAQGTLSVPNIKDNASNPTVTTSDISSHETKAPIYEMVIR